jgi:hypothetical protein
LHQGVIKTRNGKANTRLAAGHHNAVNEIEISGYWSAGQTVIVSPKKCSIKVISTIEGDFSTFEPYSGPNHPLSTFDPRTGVSGWSKK